VFEYTVWRIAKNYEKMLKCGSHQEMQSKATIMYQFIPIRLAKLKRTQAHCSQGCE
jgi:hypothetical protein